MPHVFALSEDIAKIVEENLNRKNLTQKHLSLLKISKKLKFRFLASIKLKESLRKFPFKFLFEEIYYIRLFIFFLCIVQCSVFVLATKAGNGLTNGYYIAILLLQFI